LAADDQVSDFFIGRAGKELFHRFFIPNDGFKGSLKDNNYAAKYPGVSVIKVNDTRCVLSSIIIPDYALGG
ncbi:MAG TPA: hypothetical protein VMF29_01260, partial [Candidatus Edwardsbacteria bacterium]|nr:hypothetical protein [Candidatus Edwardsbacteria bacterium]